MNVRPLPLLFFAALLGAPISAYASDSGDSASSKPGTRTNRLVQGWNVSVDDRLLAAPDSDAGTLALTYLEGDLADIASILPAEKVARLRSVRIVLDLSHGELRPMQYHPSADWLRGHGYDAGLARCVHIPRASDYTSPRHRHEQPWCVLHELAHAYHDQVLGFENAKIAAVWQRYKERGQGDKVLHIAGRHTRHYALTDAKEFFAEMSESYLGMNDFFPFNFAELKEAEPDTFSLMEETWGKLPR